MTGVTIPMHLVHSATATGLKVKCHQCPGCCYTSCRVQTRKIAKAECGFTATGPTHLTLNICCTQEPCQRDIVTIIMSVLYQVLKD